MEYHKMKKFGNGGGGGRAVGDAALVCAQQLSCDEPQVNLSSCIARGDLTTFSSLLADIAPTDDSNHLSLPDDEKQAFPLPEDHWLNQPISDENPQLLLQLSVNQPAVEFTQLLVRAGARADMYSDDFGQAVLHTAVLSEHSEQHIAALFGEPGNTGDVNVTMQPSGQTPLHLAAERGKQTCVSILLDQPGIQVDAKDNAGGRTALYLAAKGKKVECVRLLLENGANPDIKVGKMTVREAIKENIPYFDINQIKVKPRPRASTVALLVELIENRDFTSFKTVLPSIPIKELSEKGVKGLTVLQKAALSNLPSFVSLLLNYGVNPNIATTENPFRPHLLAAYYGHHQILSTFVESTRVVNKSNRITTNFAVWSRDTKETVLHLVLKMSQKKALMGIATEEELKAKEADYAKCLDILLEGGTTVREHLSRVINKKDTMENTGLHYASQMWSQEVVTHLLELGANIGVRNKRGDIPLSRILPETLEGFLDSATNHTNHPLHQDFKVEFNYSWLAPAVDDYQSEEWDSQRQAELEREGLPETESLWCMSQSSAHRHLLRHPAVTSFLWLKWQRIRRFFSRNLRMYLIFVTSLTWYIFTRFGGVALNSLNPPGSDSTNSTGAGWQQMAPSQFCEQPSIYSGHHYGAWYILFLVECGFLFLLALRDFSRECGCISGTDVIVALLSSWFELLLAGLATILIVFGSGGLWYVLTILFGLITFREILQMAASLKRYIFSLENLLEILMLSLLAVLLFTPTEPLVGQSAAHGATVDCEGMRHLAAICILLSWTELIILVARHPRLSRYNVYISMFNKVLQTFLLFLIWYSFFIIAFALGFYIMLHKDIPGFVPEEDHYKYFDNPWTSLVKTSTMFVGELEFSDIPIDTESPLAWLSFTFLLTFVFLIVVILMNLLNGLAVSDTGIIMEKAEIVSHTARVETISYMESVLLGDPFEFLAKWPPVSFLSKIPSLALCNQVYTLCPGARRASHALTGATGILLFYSLLPEKKAKFPGEESVGCWGCGTVTVQDIPEDIMQAARDLVLKKESDQRQFDTEQHGKKMMELLLLQQAQLDKLQSQVQLLLARK